MAIVAPGAIVPRGVSRRASAPFRSTSTASRSSRSVPLTIRLDPPLGLQPDRAGQRGHLLGAEQGQAPRLDQEALERRHRVRLPGRDRDVLAPDRPSVAQGQGQGGRVVGIGDRVPDPPGRIERGEPADVRPRVVAVASRSGRSRRTPSRSPGRRRRHAPRRRRTPATGSAPPPRPIRGARRRSGRRAS